MFLHDIGYDKFSIEHGDTLTDPKHWDEKTFEAIVSIPPYSIKWEGSDNGTAAIVCSPGIMYRGGAEQKISD